MFSFLLLIALGSTTGSEQNIKLEVTLNNGFLTKSPFFSIPDELVSEDYNGIYQDESATDLIEINFTSGEMSFKNNICRTDLTQINFTLSVVKTNSGDDSLTVVKSDVQITINIKEVRIPSPLHPEWKEISNKVYIGDEETASTVSNLQTTAGENMVFYYLLPGSHNDNTSASTPCNRSTCQIDSRSEWKEIKGGFSYQPFKNQTDIITFHFKPNPSHAMCLQFHYTGHGHGKTSLKIYQESVSGMPIILWTRSTSLDALAIFGQVTLLRNIPKVYFLAEPEMPSCETITLQNIMIYSQPCECDGYGRFQVNRMNGSITYTGRGGLLAHETYNISVQAVSRYDEGDFTSVEQIQIHVLPVSFYRIGLNKTFGFATSRYPVYLGSIVLGTNGTTIYSISDAGNHTFDLNEETGHLYLKKSLRDYISDVFVFPLALKALTELRIFRIEALVRVTNEKIRPSMCNTSCENMTEGMTCWQSAPVQTLHEEEEPCSGEKNYYWTQLCNASGMWSNLTKHGCDQIAYITLNSSSRTLFEYLNLRAYIERKYISGTLTPTVIIATTNLLYEIVNEATPNQTLSSVILESISYILQSPEKILQESGSSNKLLKMITHIGENMELNASEIQIVHDNLAMVILQGSEGGDGVAFTTATTNQKLSSGHIEIMKNENKPSDKASIFVPLGVVVTTNGSIEQARLIFTIFRNSAVFDSMAKGSKVARGEVISASVENRTIKGLSGDRRIRIRFGDREITDGVGKNRSDGKKCVFWDVEKYEWSGKGCFRSDNSRDGNITNYVTCICDHLTNFAMLFDYGQMDASQENALSIISLIGCSFSILGLTLTLLSYLIFPQMREGRRYRPSWILINLCCSLLGVIIVFLVSFTQKPKSGPCVALACILHYLLLVSISWMSVEAISMYLAFVKVFDDGINYFLAKSSGAAWGVPFIVIVLTIAINLEHYTNAKTCWLRQDVIPFAFMLPSGILTVFNVVMFAMIARTLTSVSVKTKTKQKGMRRLRVIFSVMVVTGMSWAFGYLITEEFSLIFSYLFAIFNSLQGSLIFLLYCARNPDVQKCWLSLIQRSKKESNRHSTTGGMPTSSVKAIPERIETTQGDPKPITTKLHSPVIISKHTSEVYLSCEDSASSDSSFEDHSDRGKPPLVKQMSQVTILYDNVSEKSPSPSKTEFHELDVVQEVEGKNVNVEDSVPS